MNKDAIKDGGPAFPVAMSQQSHSNQDCAPFQGGMTLRDYFAAKAMQGLLASTGGGHSEVISADAYRIADSMIKARSA
jgi:hypothetical protein